MIRALGFVWLFACAQPDPALVAPGDALASILLPDGEGIAEVVVADVDGDGLGDLLVRTAVDGVSERADLFLATTVLEQRLSDGEHAHVRFRGALRAIGDAGQPDGDGRHALAVGGAAGFGVFRPDELVASRTVAALDAPVRISGDGRQMLGVVGGDYKGSFGEDLVVAAADPGYPCGFLCGWWRPRERVAVLSWVDVPETADLGIDAFTGVSLSILDGPDAGTGMRLVGDVDGDGFADVGAGGMRNYAAITWRRELGEEWSDQQVFVHSCHRDTRVPACDAMVDVAPAGDVDGDGNADLVVMDGVQAWLVSGASLDEGAFPPDRRRGETPDAAFALDGARRAIGVGDVDGDGFDDLFVDGEAGARVVRGMRRLDDVGRLVAVVLDGFGARLRAEPVGDMDGDGSVDLAVWSEGSGWLDVVPLVLAE